MAVFEPALAWMLPHEGGWSNDPDDPGGATNYGVTLTTAQRHGVPDKEALRTISMDQVANIYRQDYWVWEGVDDQRVATKLFDLGVNLGVRSAVRLLQDGLNTLGAFLETDGRLGPQTLMAANSVAPEKLLQVLCLEAAQHYQAIVANRPVSQKFLKGWLTRAAAVPPIS
jgi:lysozyme family protein